MDREAIKRKLETPEAIARRAERRKKPLPLHCSFCGQEKLPAVMVAGPGVYICDECVELCVELLEQKKKQ